MPDVSAKAEEAVGEESTDSRRNPFAIDREDTYEGGGTARVVVRGRAESYEQYFVVAFQVGFHDDRVELEDLSALAGSDRSILERIDAEESYSKLTGDITTTLNRLSDSRKKDSKNFHSKFERIIREPEKLENLSEPLRDGRLNDFHRKLHEFLLSDIFPGTELRTGSRVLSDGQSEDSPEKEESSGEEATPSDADSIVEEAEQPAEDESPKMLEVRPEYDPMDGVCLRELEPSDRVDVRVVGDSLYDLKDEYIDGENAREADRSKIMNAELVEVRDAPLKSVKTFVMKLSTDARGEFAVDPSARVSFRNYDDLSAPLKFRQRLRFFLLATMIFLFLISLVFFAFPEPFLGLVEELRFSA